MESDLRVSASPCLRVLQGRCLQLETLPGESHIDCFEPPPAAGGAAWRSAWWCSSIALAMSKVTEKSSPWAWERPISPDSIRESSDRCAALAAACRSAGVGVGMEEKLEERS